MLYLIFGKLEQSRLWSEQSRAWLDMGWNGSVRLPSFAGYSAAPSAMPAQWLGSKKKRMPVSERDLCAAVWQVGMTPLLRCLPVSKPLRACPANRCVRIGQLSWTTEPTRA